MNRKEITFRTIIFRNLQTFSDCLITSNPRSKADPSIPKHNTNPTQISSRPLSDPVSALIPIPSCGSCPPHQELGHNQEITTNFHLRRVVWSQVVRPNLQQSFFRKDALDVLPRPIVSSGRVRNQVD